MVSGHAYDIGSLPDSTWTFVERRVVVGKVDNRPELVVTDHDEDVSAYVVEPEGGTLLVVIPEYDRADVSFTYLVNELADRVKNSGGSVVAIIGFTVVRLPNGLIFQWLIIRYIRPIRLS